MMSYGGAMFELDLLVSGFPGMSTFHGGLGWSSVCLLQDETHLVLLDTGGPGYVPLLQAGLEERGLRADEVTDVLITHCHWDHVSNFTLFPNARIVVPRLEMEWASQQLPGTWHLADLHIGRLLEMGAAVHLADDGEQVLPGVSAISTPGHTPGHVAYRVRTAGGDAIFAGDAVKNRSELVTGEVDLTLDAQASRRSVERIRQMLLADPKAVLIPGHDVRLSMVDGEVYPHGEWQAEISALLGTDRYRTVTNLVGPTVTREASDG